MGTTGYGGRVVRWRGGGWTGISVGKTVRGATDEPKKNRAHDASIPVAQVEVEGVRVMHGAVGLQEAHGEGGKIL